MNPPAPARIALAAFLIFTASTAIGAEKKKQRPTGKHAASADESPLVLPTAIGELADYLEKLDKRKPKNDAEVLDDRRFKIIALYNLGRFEVANGQYQKGTARLRETVSLCERMPSPATWENIHAEYIAATAEHGDFVEAIRVAKIILDRQGRTPGVEHMDALASTLKLADILTQKGELTTAEPLYRRALAVHESILGPEHENTLSATEGLALLYFKKGDLAAAEPLYRRALEVCERTLGPEHPDTCHTAYNIALLHQRQKDFAKALPLAELALKGFTKALGVEHQYTLAAKKLVDLLKQKQ